VPTLKPSDLVIADTLVSRKGPAVRTAIRDTGAKLLLLPKYSPDLNNIEQVFANTNDMLRKAAKRAQGAVCARIAELLGTYTSQSAGYFRTSG